MKSYAMMFMLALPSVFGQNNAATPLSDYSHLGNFDLSRARVSKPVRVSPVTPSGTCLIAFEQVYSFAANAIYTCVPASFTATEGTWTATAAGSGGGATPILTYSGSVITLASGPVVTGPVSVSFAGGTATLTAGTGTVQIGWDTASGLMSVGLPTGVTATCSGTTCVSPIAAMPSTWTPVGTCAVSSATVTSCTANAIVRASTVEAGANMTASFTANGVMRLNAVPPGRIEIPFVAGSGNGPGITPIATGGGYTAPVVAALGGGAFNPWSAQRCLDAQLCGWVFTHTLPSTYVASAPIVVGHTFFSGASGSMRMRTTITCLRTGDLTSAVGSPTSDVLSTVAVAAEGRTAFTHTHAAPACQPGDLLHVHFSRLGADGADTSTGSIWSISGYIEF